MRYVLAYILVLYAILSWGQSPRGPIMFFPEDWEGAHFQFEINTDHRCLGIYDNGNGSFRVKKFHLKDTTVDNPAYGLETLLVIDSVKPAFIVSGIKNLKANDEIRGTAIVHTTYANSVLVPAKPFTYEIADKKYTIFAKGNNFIDPNISQFPAIKNYRVILKSAAGEETVEQTLYSVDTLYPWPAGGFEGGVVLKWVGDLNKDNALDIILTTSNDYRGHDVILFLSTQTKGRLVEEAVRYSWGAPN